MINMLYSMGLSSLLNTQSSISVHSNNVSNVNVEGYRRRSVVMESNKTLDMGFGSVGTGASIASIYRNLSTYVEEQYLERHGEASKWGTLTSQLSQTEQLFNSTDDSGLATILGKFWGAWGTAASDQGSSGSLTALLGKADSLTQQLKLMRSAMDSQQHQIDEQMRQEVDETNRILSDLASLNKSITANPNNNSLLDTRDALLRNLTAKIGIKTQIQADGQVAVSTTSGRTLISGSKHYTLSFDGPSREIGLSPGSAYEGDIYFEGSSNSEITIDVLTDGPADGSAGAATYRVSLDGGKTWLENKDGTPKVFTAGSQDDNTTVDGVRIWFGKSGDSSAAATTNLSKGDRFTVVPKSSVYWNKNTSTKESIAPHPPDMAGGSGRESGGSIVGLLATRDSCLGEYKKQLDAMAESLAWEINRLHSQGASGAHHSTLRGQEKARSTSAALADSGLYFADRLTEGSFAIALYDSTTGKAMGKTAIDFSSIVPPGTATFDPTQHSMEDVRDAINASMGGNVTATIENNALVISAGSGVKYELASDTSGLLAGLGINNFFDGHSCDDLSVSQDIVNTPSAICVGHVNGAGEINEGDVDTAKAIAALATKNVLFKGPHADQETTFSDFLARLTSQVGTDASGAKFSYQAQQALSQDLYTRQESIGGVNMDEEMAKLLQLNKNYAAASRLIQTASDMFDTILALK